MSRTHITFAKLTATPSDSAWSIAYNAGNLFAAFALERIGTSTEPLDSFGKKITNILESEFFTLNEKSLKSIKEAIATSLKELPEDIRLTGSIAYLKDSTLYAYSLHGGQALLRRSGDTAPLFPPSKDIFRSASGFLHTGDLLLLSTSSFLNSISSTELNDALSLQLPSDMAEALSPLLHKDPDGSEAAVILTFASSEELPIATLPTEESEPEEIKAPISDNITPMTSETTPDETLAEAIRSEHEQITSEDQDTLVTQKRFTLPRLKLPFLTRKNLVFMALAFGLTALLLVTILSTKKAQNNSKSHTAFVELYNQAEKSYLEGEGLQSLNAELAQEDFKKAKDSLAKAKEYVQSGSEDEKKYTALLQKIASKNIQEDNTKPSDVTEAQAADSPLIDTLRTSQALAITEDKNFFYTIDDKAISQIDKSNKSVKKIITNNSDWKKPVAIASYLSNLYVLDQGNSVLKFVAGSDGYGKSGYFKANTPPLKNTVSMSVDGSIYLLDTDGTVRKYTKAEPDSFRFSALPSPLKNPKQLYTTTEIDNLYILDTGNSRIISSDKAGSYRATYSSELIKNASFFTVSESAKKIYLLVGQKIYQISL